MRITKVSNSALPLSIAVLRRALFLTFGAAPLARFGDAPFKLGLEIL